MARARILVVEDENIVAMEIVDLLRHLGYAVSDQVASGEEAIGRAAATCPDLVLMDIRLKGKMDGIEAAEQIHATLDIPIIYLTAYADEETLSRAKLTQPLGYLVKPFHEQELRTTIEMALYKHRMDRRLRENERWLTTTLRSIGEAVIATDLNGCVEFMNPVAEALVAHPREAGWGQDLAEILHLVDEKRHTLLENPVQQVLKTGSVIGRQNSTMLVTSEGREIPIDYNAAPLVDDQDRVCGSVLVLRDTTERKQMEQMLLRTERLAAMGYLAAALTHEISNPLQSMATSLELILDFDLDEQERQEYLRAMHREIRRLKDLTVRALDLARPPAAQRQFISLADVVRYALTLARKQLEDHGIRVELSLPGELPLVLFSHDLLVQVMLNLIINAIEAMSQGGTLRLSVRDGGAGVEVIVADSGPGLSQEAMDRVFEPFYTTKQEGTGLGLSICHSIVGQYGGSIAAVNAPGGGAVFTVTLPRASLSDR